MKSYNWDDYFIYTDEALFVHRNLSYDTIRKYAKIAYKEAVLKNPKFFIRRIWRGIKTLEFFKDIYCFIKWFFAPPFSTDADKSIYFAKDRWPVYDFVNNELKTVAVRTVSNRVVVGL
ncbi:MAG: hypothetical protein HYS98_02150 [Deltaproteobacteria bacterium]|nr:hypothetical protein [Deltaproteobacteria bacterium]